MDFNTYLIATQGASIINGEVSHFGEPVSELVRAKNSSCKTPLTTLGVVGIRGPDARDFIHAQFSTDCHELDEQRGQLSAWCSPKGRVLFLFRIVACRDGFEIIMPRSETQRFAQRLSIYVLRAQVVIEDLSDTMIVFGISIGKDSAWDPPFASVLTGALQVTHADADFKAVRLDDASHRYLIFGDTRRAQQFWQACPLAPVGQEAWTLLEICAGLPAISEATADQFLPQDLNLDLLGGVSFQKGCYPGQEIITRLKFRSIIKRRTFIARAACPRPPAPGTPLLRQDDQSGNAVGRVLVAARESADRVAVLAVVDLSVRENTTLRLGEQQGAELILTDPPYPFG